MDIALNIYDVSKKYRIGVFQHDTLRDRLAELAKMSLRRSSNKRGSKNELWALRNVTFQVRYGEVVGIIGRNGAGKSTLLKIISKITEPTSGCIETYGRIGSLLEVGTGFHPELSGKENIYLNGAILGMGRKEISRKFDEILAFAELEKFIDTPVKRYSSGMYVRLAFAVAAHLEPEILLVDEVLAVGDAAFQRKCLAKMDEVSHQGRTILFVSHNMAAVQALCNRGIFLWNGSVSADGEIRETISTYLKTLENIATQDLSGRLERRGRGGVRLTGVNLSTCDEQPSSILVTGRAARFTFHFSRYLPGLTCTFTIYDHYGQPIVNFNSAAASPTDFQDPSLGTQLVCEIEELLLVQGRYRINVALECSGDLEDHVEGAAFFDVESGHVHGRPIAVNGRFGSVCMPHYWRTPAKEKL